MSQTCFRYEKKDTFKRKLTVPICEIEIENITELTNHCNMRVLRRSTNPSQLKPFLRGISQATCLISDFNNVDEGNLTSSFSSTVVQQIKVLRADKDRDSCVSVRKQKLGYEDASLKERKACKEGKSSDILLL